MLVALIAPLALQAAVAVPLAFVERDLTGDGEPEVLRVVGVGPSIDELDVTFTIESGGAEVYRTALAPLTRTVGFDAGRRELSADEHRTRLIEFGAWFFGEGKFQSPSAFVESLTASAPGRVPQIPEVIASDRPGPLPVDGRAIWDEIRAAPVTIFGFSPGGDTVEAIGWSPSRGRFFRLLECC